MAEARAETLEPTAEATQTNVVFGYFIRGNLKSGSGIIPGPILTSALAAYEQVIDGVIKEHSEAGVSIEWHLSTERHHERAGACVVVDVSGPDDQLEDAIKSLFASDIGLPGSIEYPYPEEDGTEGSGLRIARGILEGSGKEIVPVKTIYRYGVMGLRVETYSRVCEVWDA